VTDLGISGLPVESVVRTVKIATIETKEAERIGVLPPDDRIVVSQQLFSILADALKEPHT